MVGNAVRKDSAAVIETRATPGRAANEVLPERQSETSAERVVIPIMERFARRCGAVYQEQRAALDGPRRD